MKTWLCAGMLSLFILFPWSAQATEIYKWTDENGVVHISETPPPDAAKRKVDIMRIQDSKKAEGGEEQRDDWQDGESGEER